MNEIDEVMNENFEAVLVLVVWLWVVGLVASAAA